MSNQSYWAVRSAALGAEAYAAVGRTTEARALIDQTPLERGPDVYVRLANAPHIISAMLRLGDPRARGLAQQMVEESDALGHPLFPAQTRLALAEASLRTGDLTAAIG